MLPTLLWALSLCAYTRECQREPLSRRHVKTKLLTFRVGSSSSLPAHLISLAQWIRLHLRFLNFVWVYRFFWLRIHINCCIALCLVFHVEPHRQFQEDGRQGVFQRWSPSNGQEAQDFQRLMHLCPVFAVMYRSRKLDCTTLPGGRWSQGALTGADRRLLPCADRLVC